ncbi:MAG TPA: phage holin family protein [Solirubrobacterales bacterium]|nr:phage holin family protein [Solirubrobacterales bacterium]
MRTGNGQGTELRGNSTGELIKQLSEQTSTLVRQELDLAKAELAEKGKTAGIGAGMLGGAGVAGMLALGALSAMLILLLAEAMDAWVAALIVTAIWAGAAGVLALTGRDRVREGMPPAPEQTVESVKEDVQWAKTQARSGRT